MSFAIRIDNENPVHITVSVWSGRAVGRANCGQLTFRVDEWSDFRALMNASSVPVYSIGEDVPHAVV